MSARLKISLGVSLALNLVLVSAIVGAGLMWSQIVARPARVQALRFAGEGLPPAHRAAFRAALRQTVRSLGPLRSQACDNRREAAELFVQPVFDAAAINAALDRARAADVAMRTSLEHAVVAYAATLPANERAVLAERLRDAGPLRRPPAHQGAISADAHPPTDE